MRNDVHGYRWSGLRTQMSGMRERLELKVKTVKDSRCAAVVLLKTTTLPFSRMLGCLVVRSAPIAAQARDVACHIQINTSRSAEARRVHAGNLWTAMSRPCRLPRPETAALCMRRFIHHDPLATDLKLRTSIARSLAAMAVHCAFVAALWIATALGLTSPRAALSLTLFILSGTLVFYALLRSGSSSGLADPALTLPQMAFAIVAVAMGYGALPSLRSAILTILVPVMIFGMFSLTPRQVRRLTTCTLVLFLGCMVGLSLWRPTVYPPAQELINFLLLAAVLPATSALTGQLYRLRSRLREQRIGLRNTLDQLEALIRHDALTGLANRRAMRENLEQALQRTRADGSPLCVCMIDLDHFKSINDQYGHAAGDLALARYARLAGAAMRGGDVLARWGGEEFLLLLPATALPQAALAVQRMRAAVADIAAWQDRPELRVTFSAGLASWLPGETVEQLVARADEAAYRAKTEGRDRCIMASPGSEGGV